MNYLGRMIRPGKLEIAMKRTEAVEGFQFPKPKQVRSFLGLCNVYCLFVKGFAKFAAPLNDLLKKGCLDELPAPSDEQLKSFFDLKHALLNTPRICLQLCDKPYTSDVYASTGQLWCALLQGQEDGKPLPVWYWSRTLNQAE